MRKLIIVLLSLPAIIRTSTFAQSEELSDMSAVATIDKQGNEIHYTGWLNRASFEKFKKLYDPSIITLVIDSRGGPVDTGMDLGEFVHEKNMNVHVKQHRFSSCANYVFPAGRIKYLDKDSQLGWHGSAFQIVTGTLEKASTADKANLTRALAEERKREFNFYSKLGVEPLTPLYGLDRLEHEYKNCKGWTYSLKAMKQLNIQNIILADKIWMPQDMFQNQCIFRIDSVTE